MDDPANHICLERYLDAERVLPLHQSLQLDIINVHRMILNFNTEILSDAGLLMT